MAKQTKQDEAALANTMAVPMGGTAKVNIRRYSVALAHHATLTVEASDEADALAAYYKANGIIQSDHQANIQEVKDE